MIGTNQDVDIPFMCTMQWTQHFTMNKPPKLSPDRLLFSKVQGTNVTSWLMFYQTTVKLGTGLWMCYCSVYPILDTRISVRPFVRV